MAKNLELKVQLSAIDKMTAPMRGIAQQSKRLSVGFKTDMAGLNNVVSATQDALKGVQAEQKRLVSIGKPVSQELIQSEKALLAQINSTNAAIDVRKAKMTAEMDIVRKRQAALSRGKAQMARGGMQMAGASAATYAGARFMAPGFDFEEQMSKVQALTRLDKDDPMLQKLKDQAKELGATTWASATQAADAMSFYAMAGFDPQAIMDAMPSTLDLAKAGGVEVGVAADIGSNILSAFGLDPSEMDNVADILVSVFTRTNTSIEMLGETMKYVGPVARELKIPLEESAAMAGILGNVGIQGSQAGTALRALQSRLAAPPSGAKKALEELNVQTKDAEGNFRAMPDILADVMKATEKLGSADKMGYLKAIAGEEAGAAFASFLNENSYEELMKIIEAARNADGEAKEVAEKMSNNVKGDWTGLMSALESVQIGVSELEGGGLRSLLQTITKIVQATSGWIKENPKLAGTIFKVTAGIIGVVAGLGALTFAMGIFNMVVLANPIVLVIGAAIAAVTALIYYKDDIFDFFKAFLDAPGHYIAKGIAWISELGNKISNVLNEIPVIGSLLRGVFELSLVPLKMMKQLWIGIVKGFQWIGDHWGEIVGWFSEIWNGIIVALKPLTDSIQGIWTLFKIGIGALQEQFAQLWGALSVQMQPVINIFNMIIDAIYEMIRGIKEFFSFEMPDWISSIGDGISNIGSGISSGWDYLVGNDVIEHKITPAMIAGTPIIAANPIPNTNNQTNHVEINVTAQTNASAAIIATETVNHLRNTGLLGDMR